MMCHCSPVRFTVLFWVSLMLANIAGGAEKPNIVFILADDK